MKEIYSSTHIWTLFEEFMVDMAKVCNNFDPGMAVKTFPCKHILCGSKHTGCPENVNGLAPLQGNNTHS